MQACLVEHHTGVVPLASKVVWVAVFCQLPVRRLHRLYCCIIIHLSGTALSALQPDGNSQVHKCAGLTLSALHVGMRISSINSTPWVTLDKQCRG